jgi:hypothetical protein
LAPPSFQSCHSQNDEEVYPKVLHSYGAAFVTFPLSKSGCFGDVIEREVFIVIVLSTVDPWSSRSFGGGGGSAY